MSVEVGRATFRRLALALPEVVEGAHMGHPDFRLGGKVFASLDSPREGWAMVRLPIERQAELVASAPDVFVPASGAWGRAGCTHVRLDGVGEDALRDVVRAAWQRLFEAAGARVPRAPRARARRPKSGS